MGYQIRFGTSAFAVPGVVADHYLRLANAVQLRVLLYVLRHADAEVTPAQAAAFLKMDEEQAEEAFQFWEQADVLDSGRVLPVLPEAAEVQEAPVSVPDAAPMAAVQRSSKDIKLDPSEIAAMLEDSQELKDLFALSEKMLGRPLHHMEHRSLIWLHSYLNIRSEVILTLLGYCISIEKYSLSYAEAIAIEWERQGIVTLEQAETEIQRLKREHTYIEQLCRMFEMKRKPTTQQRAYMDAWQAAGYSMELMQYAYEITIENIEKLNFKYLDKVLKGWTEQGIANPEQARLQQGGGTFRRKQADTGPTEEEIEMMNAYLSVANRFKEDDA